MSAILTPRPLRLHQTEPVSRYNVFWYAILIMTLIGALLRRLEIFCLQRKLYHNFGGGLFLRLLWWLTRVARLRNSLPQSARRKINNSFSTRSCFQCFFSIFSCFKFSLSNFEARLCAIFLPLFPFFIPSRNQHGEFLFETKVFLGIFDLNLWADILWCYKSPRKICLGSNLSVVPTRCLPRNERLNKIIEFTLILQLSSTFILLIAILWFIPELFSKVKLRISLSAKKNLMINDPCPKSIEQCWHNTS